VLSRDKEYGGIPTVSGSGKAVSKPSAESQDKISLPDIMGLILKRMSAQYQVK
jgi:hypothetical protein